MDDLLRIVLGATGLVWTLRLLVRAVVGLLIDLTGLVRAFRTLRKLF